MNSEALRLLDEMYQTAFQGFASQFLAPYRFNAAYDQLRALLSEQEPTAEYWRQAIREEISEVVISDDELQRIERRARELATTASDDTPSKSRAKRIEKQTEAPQ